jgi:regulatory protein
VDVSADGPHDGGTGRFARPPGPGERNPAGERVLGPEERLQHARDLAWRALGRRDHTDAELRRLLAAKRVDPATIELVATELAEGGYVDDASYARRFAEDRRRLDAWGAERIERRLLALGVDRELVAAALAGHSPEQELDAALELLRRRVAEPPRTPRERDRALGILLRKGYDVDTAHTALRRHAGADELD